MIATIIIVAIALAITIAAVGWIMGLWGTVAGGIEYLQIFPDSYINSTGKSIVLHVVNKGSAAAVIYKVEVMGLGTVTEFTTYWHGSPMSTDEITVSPGDDTTFTFNLGKECTEGTYYLVVIYTKAGNVYRIHLLCKG